MGHTGGVQENSILKEKQHDFRENDLSKEKQKKKTFVIKKETELGLLAEMSI